MQQSLRMHGRGRQIVPMGHCLAGRSARLRSLNSGWWISLTLRLRAADGALVHSVCGPGVHFVNDAAQAAAFESIGDALVALSGSNGFFLYAPDHRGVASRQCRARVRDPLNLSTDAIPRAK
jgi:hypothetical protein